MDLKNFYVTFSLNHSLVSTRGWVRLRCENYEQAMNLATLLYQNKYGNIYTEQQFDNETRLLFPTGETKVIEAYGKNEKIIEINDIEYDVIWGWDRPLKGYFLTVFRKDRETRDDESDDSDFNRRMLAYDSTGQGIVISFCYGAQLSGILMNDRYEFAAIMRSWKVPEHHIMLFLLNVPIPCQYKIEENVED